LIRRGKLAVTALERAERLRAETGERLELLLTKLGLVSERDLAEAFAEQLGLSLLDARDFPVTPVLEGQLSTGFLKEARFIPMQDRGDGVILAIIDSLYELAATAIRFPLK